MLITLLSWLYITGVCAVWGNIVLHPFLKSNTVPAYAPTLPLLCFAGLAGIGTIALYLSLFMPLSLPAHVVILLPAIGYLLKSTHRQRIGQQFTAILRQLNRPTWLLLITCLLVMLVISSSGIIHPDTLAYHTQAIRLMEQYKAIPGIVHIRYETAMTSMWFAVQALFRFNFIHPNNYLFINGCVAGWFCLFVCTGIAGTKNSWQFAGWLLLLVYCFISWTQIRLTAASASPDFIAVLFIWTALYAFSQSSNNAPVYTWLCIVCCCAAITIKLSAIAIALLVLIVCVRSVTRRQFNTTLAIAGVALAILLPYFARNIISSGYPLYPSAFGHWWPVSWQLKEPSLHRFQHYITAYARFEVASYEEAERALAMPYKQWLPLWWHALSRIDQLLLLAVILLLGINIIKLRTGVGRLSFANKILLLVSLTGSIVWFVAAPAIRFGTGFLVPLLYALFVAAAGAFNIKGIQTIHVRYGTMAIYAVCAALLLYGGYRFNNFFTLPQLVTPAGVKQTSYRVVNLQGVPVTIADTCGFAPAPCTSNPDRFITNGKDIQAGFREK